MTEDPTDTRAIRETMICTHVVSVVSAYVKRNPIPHENLPALISSVFTSLDRTRKGPLATAKLSSQKLEKTFPAINRKKSITPDHIICLEDGLGFKSLKKHLRTAYGLTPEQYREKWGLDSSYPMVAPNYSARRSQIAREMQLGIKRASSA